GELDLADGAERFRAVRAVHRSAIDVDGGDTAWSSRERSSEERYSEPSKWNLMESTREALNAKVAQPMITPISTPGTKPHS
ncbi:hypothetical protein, partial [Escherichia coli]|uniref:hypothetical protein n=1 Tax=Escherichia coli TaxID=562 RepID=UPI0015C4A151